MAVIPYDVAEAFIHGKLGSRGAFVSHGNTLYSYGLKLASREKGIITVHVNLEPGTAPSVTTARHIKALREVLS